MLLTGRRKQITTRYHGSDPNCLPKHLAHSIPIQAALCGLVQCVLSEVPSRQAALKTVSTFIARLFLQAAEGTSDKTLCIMWSTT